MERCCPRPNPGSKILIESTPFGSAFPEVFHKTQSSGIVSNASSSAEYSVFITDAQAMIDSEGSPVFQDDRVSGLGEQSVQAGFAIAEDVVLTCGHVLDNSRADPGDSKTWIRLNPGASASGIANSYVQARSVYVNKSIYPFDLAVLRLDAAGSIRPLRMSSELPKIGQPILGIGYHGLDQDSPDLFGARPSMTRGEIIGIKKFHDHGAVLLLTNCSLQSGMSGGPVLDARGNVIGIMTSHVQDHVRLVHYPNVNFVIPIIAVKEGLERYLEDRNPTALEEALKFESEGLNSLWSLDRSKL